MNILGWSCPICEDLRILLSPEELAETNVINDFFAFGKVAKCRKTKLNCEGVR
jgi:hypothetical protein